MANQLIRLRPVSASQPITEDPFGGQQIVQPVNGMSNGAGVAVDRSENVYVADWEKHVIFKCRRGMPSQVWVGAYGVSGLADGQGGAARFNHPAWLACDRSGVLYVVDLGNARLRRVDQNGNVFTVAAISSAFLGGLGGLAVDDSGNIFLVDNA